MGVEIVERDDPPILNYEQPPEDDPSEPSALVTLYLALMPYVAIVAAALFAFLGMCTCMRLNP